MVYVYLVLFPPVILLHGDFTFENKKFYGNKYPECRF